MRRRTVKVSGFLTEETEKSLIHILIEDEADLLKLAKHIGSPLFEDEKKGEVFALDPEKRVKYFIRR